ncbi:MAG: hemerythrin domain-containing protein [Polyangiaceae bacterium]
MASHPQLRAELWPQVRHALLAHDQGEVRVLCPDLHEFAATRALAQRHDVEARDLESMIRLLAGRDYDDSEWLASALTLRQLVLRHVQEEESELFPRAQAVLGAARAEELKEDYLRHKAQGGSRSTRGNGPLGGTP